MQDPLSSSADCGGVGQAVTVEDREQRPGIVRRSGQRCVSALIAPPHLVYPRQAASDGSTTQAHHATNTTLDQIRVQLYSESAKLFSATS